MQEKFKDPEFRKAKAAEISDLWYDTHKQDDTSKPKTSVQKYFNRKFKDKKFIED